jgi:hypothetical protein
MIRHLLASATVLAVVSNAAVQAHAADLDVRPYLLGRSLKLGSVPPSPASAPGVQPPTPLPHAASAPHRNQKSPSLPRAIPRPMPPVFAPPPKAAPVVPAVVRDIEPAVPAASEGFWAAEAHFLLFVVPIALFLAFLPDLVRWVDRLLEIPIEEPGDAPSSNFQAAGLAVSAADLRRQMEAMRAMKEAMDAELASVRAQIDRERKRAAEWE